MLKDNAVVSKDFLDDAYAFNIERQLIDVFAKLGINAEYILDDQNKPTALLLTISPAIKVGGHEDKIEQFTIRAINNDKGAAQLAIELVLPEIDVGNADDFSHEK